MRVERTECAARVARTRADQYAPSNINASAPRAEPRADEGGPRRRVQVCDERDFELRAGRDRVSRRARTAGS